MQYCYNDSYVLPVDSVKLFTIIKIFWILDFDCRYHRINRIYIFIFGVHSTFTLIIYTHHLHSSFTLNRYTHHLHSSFTLIIYTHHLHSIFTLNLYTHHLHSSFTLNLYTQPLHSTFTLNLYTQPLHSTFTLNLYTQPLSFTHTCTCLLFIISSAQCSLFWVSVIGNLFHWNTFIDWLVWTQNRHKNSSLSKENSIVHIGLSFRETWCS